MSSPFWSLSNADAGAPALIENDEVIDYGTLNSRAQAWTSCLDAIKSSKSFGFLVLPSSSSAIACYLACMSSKRHVPLLIQSTLSDTLLVELIQHYGPDWIVLPESSRAVIESIGVDVCTCGGMTLWKLKGLDSAIHSDLALLLNTSGSTGSSKLVRISYAAIDANAKSIAAYLSLKGSDRAITTLPLAYSFGLSILNSHLFAGGALVLTEKTWLDKTFWSIAKGHLVTSLSGVPASFEILYRLGLKRIAWPTLRMLTQAGGRLRENLVSHFANATREVGMEFFVMYGQTEASPRISYVPSDRIAEKSSSIGIAVPGGDLAIDSKTGELVYTGPNVMMGYAEVRQDLAKGDEMGGTLHTGDLAVRDEDGFFTITGRLKRFVKLSGSRFNLDDIERLLCNSLKMQVACSGSDDALRVAVVSNEDVMPNVAKVLQDELRIFNGHVEARQVIALPLMASGKVDYRALDALFRNEESA